MTNVGNQESGRENFPYLGQYRGAMTDCGIFLSKIQGREAIRSAADKSFCFVLVPNACNLGTQEAAACNVCVWDQPGVHFLQKQNQTKTTPKVMEPPKQADKSPLPPFTPYGGVYC